LENQQELEPAEDIVLVQDPAPDFEEEAKAVLPETKIAEEPTPTEILPPPWERPPRSEEVETELKKFCRRGELVYAAVVDYTGTVEQAVCTVGSRPHNEAQIGELVGKVFATAQSLGSEVGERNPQGLSLQGARWSYSLDILGDEQLLFGIFSSKALPAIVRAAAMKVTPALEQALQEAKASLQEP